MYREEMGGAGMEAGRRGLALSAGAEGESDGIWITWR